MVKAQKWVLVKHFDGFPKDSDFKLEEEELPEIKDGEFLCEVCFLTVDPYMRIFSAKVPIGGTFIGEQIAKVTESKNSEYPVGSHVSIHAGWRTHTISDGRNPVARVLPSLGDLPLSYALSVLGASGCTAFFGFMDIGSPRSGDVVYVNGAAGAVGCVVGQLAKIRDCTVIGCAGTKEKCDWLKSLGFDQVFNYKERDPVEALKELAPDGIDIFYDNVGGEATSLIMGHMRRFGRVVVCGNMSSYNEKGPQKGALPYQNIMMKELKVEGFTFARFVGQRADAEHAMMRYLQEGRMTYTENVMEGFDKMPQAFFDMLKGKNMGKTVVKV